MPRPESSVAAANPLGAIAGQAAMTRVVVGWKRSGGFWARSLEVAIKAAIAPLGLFDLSRLPVDLPAP